MRRGFTLAIVGGVIAVACSLASMRFVPR